MPTSGQQTIETLIHTYLYTTQATTQSAALRQSLKIDCNSDACTDCRLLLLGEEPASEICEEICDKICKCEGVDLTMSAHVLVNFDANLESTTTDRMKSNFVNSIVIKTKQASDKFSKESLENAMGRNVHNGFSFNDVLNRIVTNRTIQKSIQEFTMNQTYYQNNGKANHINLNMDADVKAIANLISHDLSDDDMVVINKFSESVDVSIGITSSAFSLLTSWVIEIILLLAVAVVFLFNATLIFQLI